MGLVSITLQVRVHFILFIYICIYITNHQVYMYIQAYIYICLDCSKGRMDLPAGHRFLPTDEDLLEHYLINKVFFRPVAAGVIQEIHADELYSKSPKSLGNFSIYIYIYIYDIAYICFIYVYTSFDYSVNFLTVKNLDGRSEWYFFIHQDEYFCGKIVKDRMVGNGNEKGFWRSLGDEVPIYDSEGSVFGFKIYFTYFNGSSPVAKQTHWRLQKFRLSCKYDQEVPYNKRNTIFVYDSAFRRYRCKSKP